MLSSLLRMTATVTTPGESVSANSMGDPIPGPSTTALVACWCEQASSDELTAGMDLTRSHWKLYTAADSASALRSTSTVSVDAYPALVFDVDGEPWLAINPSTNAGSHVQTQLVVSDGAS